MRISMVVAMIESCKKIPKPRHNHGKQSLNNVISLRKYKLKRKFGTF